MWPFLRRIKCQCTSCNRTRYIPRRRIIRIEQVFDVKYGQRFAWTCLDCYQGVVFPSKYVNSYGELVVLNPEAPPEDLIVLHL